GCRQRRHPVTETRADDEAERQRQKRRGADAVEDRASERVEIGAIDDRQQYLPGDEADDSGRQQSDEEKRERELRAKRRREHASAPMVTHELGSDVSEPSFGNTRAW